jgi:transketolase
LDVVTLIRAGITLHEAINAAKNLDADGIAARVIDLYSIKPIDAATLVAAARETGRIVTIEDHRPEGGLGEAVVAALAEADLHPRVSRLAVADMPGSATPQEQLAEAGIDAPAIAAAAKRLVRRPFRRASHPFIPGSRSVPGSFTARREPVTER